jgi:hypothetical protein
MVGALALPATVQAQYFFDNFDSYANGSNIAGQGGWETWGGDPGANTFVTSQQSFSSPHSLWVAGTADVVQRFTGVTSGTWYAKVQTYVPSTQTGNMYFIMLNRYDGFCAAAGDCDWSVQVRMAASEGIVESQGGSSNPGAGALAIVTDAWVEILVEIDLDANTYNVYYGGTLLDTLGWTVTGDINIAAFDLFSDGCTEGYMDDVWLDPTIPVELMKFEIE